MTWSVQDPSLSHATSRAIRNIVGYPGAIGADLLMQILGLGAIMLILPVAVWGWRMLTHRTFDREALRLSCWILCTVMAAGFASCWPHGGAWPLPTGLGGVVGDALVRAPAVVFGPPGIVYGLVLGIILGAATVATFLVASGMGSRPQEEELTPIEDDEALFVEEDDRGSISLGWAVHALMSAKARLSRLLGAAYGSLVASAPSPRTSSFERQEPVLGGRAAPSLSPQSEEDFEDEEEEEEEEIPAARAPRKKAAARAPARKTSDRFELPSVSVLTAPRASDRQPLSKSELDSNSRALEGVLGDFGVRGEIVKANPGPVVTLYELEPAPGIKSSRVIGLADDIARSMSALSARVAVVPGRNAIGIELPNAHREKVYLERSAQRASSFERQEPSLGGRAPPSLAPQTEEDFDDEEEAKRKRFRPRAPRARRPPPAPPARKSSDRFELPSVSVLTAPKASDRQPLSKSELDSNSRALEGVLGDFGVRGEIVKAHPGPVVTLYELEPAPGIKSSRVIGLADDIARSMSALSARVAVVPGRNAIGIELPNAHREKVYLRELLSVKDGNESVAKLPLCLGKNIGGESIIVDLARMPHLLIAGTTGSGKSVAINTMILSLVYRLRPDQCRLIMVDPKMLELSVYDGIPHLLTPVVTDPKKAVVALKWAVREMEERYKGCPSSACATSTATISA